ncbi:MAG TPA: hypothetical protein DCR55_07540 [Lentisphaeria bacterium]|nr:hypothetical protein [Lentisphaeria bacterium]
MGDSNRDFSSEIEMVRRNGTIFPALAFVEPMHDDHRKQIGALGVVSDITTRKPLEDEARRLHDRIQQLQKLESLSALAGRIAHEFQNVLVGILGSVEIALSDLNRVSPIYSSVEEIKAASLRA